MTSARAVTPLFRLAAAGVAIGAIPLSGCLYSDIAAAQCRAGPDPRLDRADSTTFGGDLPAALSFEDGTLLPVARFADFASGEVLAGAGVTIADRVVGQCGRPHGCPETSLTIFGNVIRRSSLERGTSVA